MFNILDSVLGDRIQSSTDVNHDRADAPDVRAGSRIGFGFADIYSMVGVLARRKAR